MATAAQEASPRGIQGGNRVPGRRQKGVGANTLFTVPKREKVPGTTSGEREYGYASREGEGDMVETPYTGVDHGYQG